MATDIRTRTPKARCLEHLEVVLGVPIDKKKLIFDQEKKQVTIRDVQLFHEIARARGLTELRRGQSSCYYYLNVPNGFGESEDCDWVVTLPSVLNQEFLINYGGGYRYR